MNSFNNNNFDTITITPSKSSGSITIPSSKSILHRAIICASLAKGRSVLENVYISNDIMHTIERFIIPILTLFDKEFKIYCDEGLFNRPFSVFEELFEENGGVFELDDEVIEGKTKYFIKVSGKLKKNKYTIDGSISSQFISGMLFTLPLLNHDSTLITENVQSKGYIFLTLDYEYFWY